MIPKLTTQILRTSAILLFVILTVWSTSGVEARELKKEPRSHQQDLTLPEGTILPVRLNSALSSAKNKVGERITGRLMQDVPLPNGKRIKAGAKVVGEISEVNSISGTGNGQIVLRFHTLESGHQQLPIRTSLRALASWPEVYNAQLAATSQDYGTSDNWATTVQVGGDTVYGFQGPVIGESGQTVGVGVNNGVLAPARAKPGTECRGAVAGNDRPQALWVFSADACGVYGYPNLRIEHAGRTEPLGQIALIAVSGEVSVRGASGLLLRVI